MTAQNLRSVYFIAVASALVFSLYNTTQYELRALVPGGSLSSTRKATTASDPSIIVQRTTPGPTQLLHFNHSNSVDASSTKLRTHAFPRWGKEGIDIATLLDFIFHSSMYAVAPQQRTARRQQQDNVPYYRPTNDHDKDVGYWFPEVLYILDAEGIWCSRRHRDILTNVGRATVRQKLEPVEDMILAAVKRLGRLNGETTPWPRLANAIPFGIPFLAFFGDFTGCNRFNWQDGDALTTTPAVSIPLFTTAAAVSCDYAIPFPNYQTIHDASTISKELFPLWKELYPSESKIPKVVWRGSLTGNVLLNDTHKSIRWAVMEKFHNHSSGLFDVGATRLPKRHEGHDVDLSTVGGIVEGFEMEDFQKYTAILDMDGNSWSSRFGKMLCFNSVILKMEPDYVDYFFYDLIPWVHYIPVSNLDDLLDKTRYALDPNRSEIVEQIVANANEWCRRRMVRDRIAEDMLYILEGYVKMLDTGSGPDWQQTKLWTQAKALIQETDHPLAMDLLLPTTGIFESVE